MAIQAAQPLVGCDMVRNYKDWPVSTAQAICMAESHGNINAIGYNTDGSIDRGLMQINSVHADMVSSLGDLFNPQTNINVAHRLWSAKGFKPWSTYQNGKYLRYM